MRREPIVSRSLPISGAWRSFALDPAVGEVTLQRRDRSVDRDVRGTQEVPLRDMMKRLAFPLFAGALLAGCATAGEGIDPKAPIVALVDVAERKVELAAIDLRKRRSWCARVYGGQAVLARDATISGPAFFQKSNAQAAGDLLFFKIESYYAGSRSVAEQIRDTLEEGARIGAFTVLLPYRPPEQEFANYNVMNEPVFQVANFMVPLAHAYLILKEEYPEDDALLTAVERWGDQLFEVTRSANDDFLGVAKGVDRRALIAAGWASWGNATKNRAALTHAYRYYLLVLQSIGRGGADQFWVQQPHLSVLGENREFVGDRLNLSAITVGAALVSAHALQRSGARDVYTVAPGGGTIVEGVTWLWNKLQEAQPRNLLQSRHGGGEGVGWVELFLHEFPEHPLAEDIDAWLDERRPLYLNMGGGPTTCLYRRIAHA